MTLVCYFMGNDDYLNWSENELIKEIKKLKTRKKYGIVCLNYTFRNNPNQYSVALSIPVYYHAKGTKLFTFNPNANMIQKSLFKVYSLLETHA